MNIEIMIIGMLGIFLIGLIAGSKELPPTLKNPETIPDSSHSTNSSDSSHSTNSSDSSHSTNSSDSSKLLGSSITCNQVGGDGDTGFVIENRCSAGTVRHVSVPDFNGDPDNDGASCRRLSQSPSQFPQTKKPWSVIGHCGPALRDPRQYRYQNSLADIYPTMGRDCLNRLPEFLEPQRPEAEIIKEQQELIDHYRQQVHDVDSEYLQARRAGQKLFENPLNYYQEPLMDPTRPPDKQAVSLGLKPEQLVFLGDYSVNQCGELEPRLQGGDFILFRNTIKSPDNK